MPTHRAVLCKQLGLGDGVALGAVECAPLTAGTLRIRIAAAGVNFPDLLMVQGLYQFKPPLPFVPGMEAAGRVIECAPGSRFTHGDAVFVLARNGTFADEIVAPEATVQPLPPGMSMEQGATFGVASLTAYHTLKTRAHVTPGQTVLVLGASGGVGAATVQFAKALGAEVIAAASTPAKLAFAAALGADHVIDYGTAKLELEVARLTAGRGADIIVDPVGWQPESLCRAIAFGGQIMMVGFAGGTLPNYPANRLLLKSASLVGVRAGEAGRHNPAARVQEWADLLTLASKTSIRPVVSQLVPLADFRRALNALAARQALGRIALDCSAT